MVLPKEMLCPFVVIVGEPVSVTGADTEKAELIVTLPPSVNEERELNVSALRGMPLLPIVPENVTAPEELAAIVNPCAFMVVPAMFPPKEIAPLVVRVVVA
jgi:hypothetical protein